MTPFHLRPANLQDRLAKISNEGARKCAAGRRADAREVAYPIPWLASDEASYVNGSVVMVYGGRFTR